MCTHPTYLQLEGSIFTLCALIPIHRLRIVTPQNCCAVLLCVHTHTYLQLEGSSFTLCTLIPIHRLRSLTPQLLCSFTMCTHPYLPIAWRFQFYTVCTHTYGVVPKGLLTFLEFFYAMQSLVPVGHFWNISGHLFTWLVCRSFQWCHGWFVYRLYHVRWQGQSDWF